MGSVEVPESRSRAAPTAVAPGHEFGFGRPSIHKQRLNRPWMCSACGKQIARGAAVVVTITPGEGPNRVEHDPACFERHTEGRGAMDRFAPR
jgi:hypothetical protein